MFVRSGFLPIFDLSFYDVSFACILCILNSISWCFILHKSGHLVNLILPSFQFTSGLCLTNQSCPRNMSMPLRSSTTTSRYFLCLLISTFNDTILSGAVHTGVEVHRIDSEWSRLVEQPWLQLMCCTICLLHGHNFRW